MTLENIVYACYEEHKKHTSNWQHGKPQKAYYDLEGLKIFYEDGKIWHYRVNPEVIFKGSHSNRMGICYEYKETDTKQQKED